VHPRPAARAQRTVAAILVRSIPVDPLPAGFLAESPARRGGIGSATAELFAREGARVVGVDLAEHPVGELALRVDLTDEHAVAALYERVRHELGRVDVLFR
jgi:hypothetical protein